MRVQSDKDSDDCISVSVWIGRECVFSGISPPALPTSSLLMA